MERAADEDEEEDRESEPGRGEPRLAGAPLGANEQERGRQPDEERDQGKWIRLGASFENSCAEKQGGKPPWPAFGDVDLAAMAAAFGCPARRVTTRAELAEVLDDVVPGLATRTEPLLLDVAVQVETHFDP